VGLRSSMSTKAVPKLSLRLAVFGPMAAALLLASSARAQSPATQTQAESNPRSPVPAGRLVTQALDETQRVSLDGTVHPLAQARFDQGAVPDSFPANRMLLILNRAPDREAALQQFLADVHTQGSASFHKWLTPAQFGALYGPADSDIQTAKSWLTSHGFQVSRVTAGKQFVEFSGTAADVREAFHSEIHRYAVNGETHYANSSELAIPAALASLIRGVSPINNFHAKPAIEVAGPALYSHATGKATPLFTTSGGTFFGIAPEDFATQYDLGPLYTAGTNGTGQTIGIIGNSNIDISLPNAYRQMFGLTANPPQVVIDGGDPGTGAFLNGDTEAYLDVELSGAVAPSATINLYISDGSLVQDPLNMATLRAIEDNQASVLSASINECETELGSGGNGMWFNFWEQAAAQGQTVLVAAGDSGSGDCAVGADASGGLGVNGIASTPWNVAVGGTDFLYPDPSAGLSAAAPFWNSTNDANGGSLKAPVPEQPWDAVFGQNILNFPEARGGGGGASSCAVTVSTPGGCSGYPKPFWQNSSGVPNDSVRDVPDVSLFAATGNNLSAYVVCTEEADCEPGSQSLMELVGGTSASAPAMARIIALVDQKYGRQGQADFTLYPLSRQQLTAFHDITVGSNNVPCAQGTPNCSLDSDGDGLYSLQQYPAGPGYDQASGIGSIDANQLVADWNKVTFTASATSLTLSPATIVHGNYVTVTSTVAPASGSGAPGGTVALLTSGSLPLPLQFASPLQLADGTAEEETRVFPGSTYQVTAQYFGDGVFGPSTSAPVSLTVTPEASTLQFTAEDNSGPVNSGGQGPYGESWVFTAQIVSTTVPGLTGLATGTVTITDGSSSREVAVGVSGEAAYSSTDFSVGSHSIAVSYSGDASYQASTAGPFAITVTPGVPLISIPTVNTSVPIGGNLVVTVVLGTGYGTPPSGNVSVSLGATTLTAPLVPVIGTILQRSAAVVTFSNLQSSGSFTLSATYLGDSNWGSANTTYPGAIVVAASTLAASTTTLSISPTTVSAQTIVTLSATVQSASGSGPLPTGSVTFYAAGQAIPGTLMTHGAGPLVATGLIQGLAANNGSNSVVAVYSGDANYNPSASAPQTFTANNGTFGLSLAGSRIVVPAGQSGTADLLLVGSNGFNSAVSLSCIASTAIGCSVEDSAMVSGNTGAILTVNAYTTTQLAGNIPSRTGRDAGGWTGSRRRLPPPGILIVTALALWLGFCRAPRRRSLSAKFAGAGCVAILFLLLNACGGGSGSSPPPPPEKTDAPPGTYSVTVNATSGGAIHNVKLIVVVQ
jgi:trimeric autotransporter adhesin